MNRTGWLLYESSDAEHNKWFIEKLQKECGNLGLDLKLVYTDFIADAYNMNLSDIADELIKNRDNPDVIVNRSRNFDIAYEFEKRGTRVVNPAEVTRIGNDKELSYKLADRLGIPYMPYICVDRSEYAALCDNRSKHSIEGTPEFKSLCDKAADFGYPLVLKPIDGHGGSNVYLVNDCSQLQAAFQEICSDRSRHPYRKFLIQRCASVTGRDLRIYIMNNKIIAGMLRIADNSADFRANFSLGARAAVHTLTREERFFAEELAEALPSDYIGIDLIYHNGGPVFNEIEDAVGSRMLYEKTDLDAVKMFAGHICSTTACER